MKTIQRSMFVCLTILITFIVATAANASWPAGGRLVNSLPQTGQINTASDGTGGIFMSWPGASSTTLQRVSAVGDLLLGPNGVTISPITSPTPCFSDNAGGVYVAGYSGSYVRLLRIGAAGNVGWTRDIAQTPGAKSGLHASPDGAGGALVAWSEVRNLPAPQDAASPYCQRVDANGNAMYAANGVRITYNSWIPPHGSSSVGLAVNVVGLCASGDGGAFVVSTYEDYFAGTDPTSVHFLPSTGTNPTDVTGTYNELRVVSDGAGGVYVALSTSSELRLKRYTPGVGFLWDIVLASFVSPSAITHAPAIALTSGGVLIAWGRDYDVYAQKVSSGGSAQWTAGGIPVCPVIGNQDGIVIGPDFHGGAHVFWSDARYGQRDLYHQHIDSNGVTLLGLDYGEPFTSNDDDDINAALYMDPAGYGIVAWTRAASNYALRFGSMATAVGPRALVTSLEQNIPNPFNPRTTIGFTLEKAGRASINVYAVNGTLVRTLLDERRDAGPNRVSWDGTDQSGKPVASGVYMYRLSSSGQTATRKMLLLK
ncbi:MAG TPA: FlgD immunoglobulin-like domain containing protein [Candidatus Krumholzibacteria bacterium]|nr:FlgD immunoglobulin-like domain containing protein [Candidatus Krumholzibacteria bacterium]